ncbi:hypothetical protein [Aquimarina longa]|uniref:hypothetical protein n=1 Tax=Aquimarina longa TaxID=1080221 RepID=UPI0011DFABD8|nr:hypothetical protein [Aquimarina longa]
MTIKQFLFPTLLIYCYQLTFILLPVDKIDEGFYTELVGWSTALIMSSIVIFSNEFLILVSRISYLIYLKVIRNSYHLKLKIRDLISFIVSTRNNDFHTLDKKSFDKDMWEVLKKTSK